VWGVQGREERARVLEGGGVRRVGVGGGGGLGGWRHQDEHVCFVGGGGGTRGGRRRWRWLGRGVVEGTERLGGVRVTFEDAEFEFESWLLCAGGVWFGFVVRGVVGVLAGERGEDAH